MTAAPSLRLAAAMGTAIAAVVALWWLGSARLAIDGGADAARSSAQALQASGLVRAMAVAMLAPRFGSWHGWRRGASAALALIAPSWPVVALAWSASVWPLWSVLRAEAALLVAGITLPLVGLWLRLAFRRSAIADLFATCIGIAMAALTWWARTLWAN